MFSSFVLAVLITVFLVSSVLSFLLSSAGVEYVDDLIGGCKAVVDVVASILVLVLFVDFVWSIVSAVLLT